jgi:hypothetical protein
MISRRRFLLQSSALFAGMFCGTAAMLQCWPARAGSEGLPTNEGFLIGSGTKGSESLFGSSAYEPTPGSVKIWYPGQTRTIEITLPFFPHSFTSHPSTPYRVIAFEKWGRHLAEIDLESLTVVRVTEAQPGRRFFGHGAHAGDYFYATQMDDKHGKGLVSVMDAASHKVVHEFETHGVFPHDCQLTDSHTLQVMNSRSTNSRDAVSGNRSSLVWLDTVSGECCKQIFIETPEFGYAHFARSVDGYTALAGSYDSPKADSRPLLSVIRPDDSISSLIISGTTLRGEVLSLYLNETDHLMAATLPVSSQVQIWNYRSGELIHQIKIPEPRGLSYSAVLDGILLSSASTKSILSIDRTFISPPKIVAPHIAGNGSHLYRFRI